jgi:mitogen-activated protein kinase 1/3
VKSNFSGPVDVGNGMHQYVVRGTTFDIPINYQLKKAIGFGAYGLVCSATNTENNKRCSIKKCSNVFHELEDGKRILREIKLMAFFQHENLLSITDLLPPTDRSKFEEVYIVTDLMATDLNNVFLSKQKLTEEHFQYFIYQVLRGLKYIHSAQVMHRDLKPANLLTNVSCDLKICDFGLSRRFDPNDRKQKLTEYVVTRYYRAPELLLMETQYTPAIDIWSVGCIFAEMMNRRQLFHGRDYLHQLSLINDVCGNPAEDDLSWVTSLEALRYMQSMPKRSPKALETVIPKLSFNCLAVDFLQKMLVFNPARRQTAEELLAHPYLSAMHNCADEPVAPTTFDWEFDDTQLKAPELRNLFWDEICKFHPELETRDPADGNQ